MTGANDQIIFPVAEALSESTWLHFEFELAKQFDAMRKYRLCIATYLYVCLENRIDSHSL